MDYSDDCERRGVSARCVDSYRLSDGLLPGPPVARGPLIHDGDGCAGLAILFGELPALDDSHPERLEVPRADGDGAAHQGVAREGKIGTQRHRLDSGKLLKA